MKRTSYKTLMADTLKKAPAFLRNNPFPNLSAGNEKLKKLGTVGFDLPAGLTCPGALQCSTAEYCYAMKGNYMLPSKLRLLADNFFAAKKAINDAAYRQIFVHAVTRQLYELKATSLRLHTAGDFFGQEYVNLWFDTISHARAQGLSFSSYTYTKSLHLDFSALGDVANVVQSMGGKYDRLIDYTRPHARIFADEAELVAAGYENGSDDDRHAMTGTVRIGLILRRGTAGRYKEA